MLYTLQITGGADRIEQIASVIERLPEDIKIHKSKGPGEIIDILMLIAR